MFELTPVGVIMVAVGLMYMLFVGRKMLPTRGGEESLTEQYHIREYISEVLVLPDSHLIGKTLGEANINLELDLNILGIIRGEEQRIAPRPHERIEAGDLLIVEGRLANILNIKAEAGLEIKPEFKLNGSRYVFEACKRAVMNIGKMNDTKVFEFFRQTF